MQHIKRKGWRIWSLRIDKVFFFRDDDCDEGLSRKRKNNETICFDEGNNLRGIRRQRLQGMKLCLSLSVYF